MINTKIELFMLEYTEPFNYLQTIVILVSKQIGSDSFKNKITYKLLTHKSYEKKGMHLIYNCKQMNSGSFKFF